MRKRMPYGASARAVTGTGPKTDMPVITRRCPLWGKAGMADL
jgi:hypothetical protein